MDFFRSILADDPEPQSPDNHEQSDSNQSPNPHETEDDDSTSNINSSEDDGSGDVGASGGLWSFGDLVKTLTTKSESVLETYRRDLKEFGTGLRKESDLFCEVASRAVKELPASIDVGTSAIDGVLKSTADIISQGKDALLAGSSDVDDYSDRSVGSMRYNRFDAQLNVIRNDVRVYCEDPEDVEDYNKWKVGFAVGDKKDEIEELVGENGELVGMYEKLVPNEVDDATFWFRYFYRVYKLKQQEETRAKLVKRSLSADDEEELSWDVDDDEDDDEVEQQQQQQQADKIRSSTSKGQDLVDVKKKDNADDEIKTQSSKIVDEDKEMTTSVVSVDKNDVESTVKKVESVPESDEKVDIKLDSGETKEDNNVMVKSNELSNQEDEDLEWDEIEDIEKTDDKNVVSHGETTNKGDLRKRLSTVADDDEDLSWDIEDDDEPLKPGNK
ncbi:uncharacterized protein LOC143533768 [Bidens hawaiensis]|uniref:uncharacterized protein LOC143533768 n=1 Tax=Bidens hawaiensis TaxID=980011 RepID=UPI004048EEF9